MPCLEEANLSELANQHIVAQKATITRLRNRLGELEVEYRNLPQDSDRAKVVYDAMKHLKLELNGEVEVAPGKFQKDASKKTAEERAEVMAQLYTQRKQYVFHDTTKDSGNPRKASLFGYPTIEEMLNKGYTDIANEMMVRAASLLQGRSDSRNPVDFLDTDGYEVKQALANLVEHHHIFNNVYVNDDGRVEFKSAKIYADPKTGELKMTVIPSYWNAEQHGRNTQFIGLMDAMHAGEDPVTHLHYYRFNDAEAKTIKAKLVADLDETVASAKKRRDKLENDLGDLEFRRSDPAVYERDLRQKIQTAQAELEERKAAAKGLLSKAKSGLNETQLALREAHDAKKREISQTQKRLDEHLSIQSLRSDIAATEGAIANLQSQAKAINLSKIPKEERDVAKVQRIALVDQVTVLRNQLKTQKKLLKTKGDIEEQIAEVRAKLRESESLAELTPAKVEQMFESQNGFFSFDKGFAEKDDHGVYRPIMNEEIHRFYVRQTLEYLQEQHGDRYLEVLREMGEKQYRNSLLERLGALMDKLPEAA